LKKKPKKGPKKALEKKGKGGIQWGTGQEMGGEAQMVGGTMQHDFKTRKTPGGERPFLVDTLGGQKGTRKEQRISGRS